LAEPHKNGPWAVGLYAWCHPDLDRTTGGLESYVAHLARHLARTGVTVVVHCFAEPTAGWHVRDGEFAVGGTLSTPHPSMHVFAPCHGPGFEGTVDEHRAVAEALDERVVIAFGTRHGHVFDTAGAVAARIERPAVAFYCHAAEERRYRSQYTSRVPGVPAVASAAERDAFEAEAVAVIRSLGRDFGALVVPTEYLRGQFSAVLPAEDMAKVLVAYTGPDTAAFPARGGPWTGDGPWLQVARCAVPNALHKNFTWSCELIRATARSLPTARLELCGEGNAAPLIRDYALRHGLTDRITVTGQVPQSVLAEKYRAASFLLMPSMMEAGATVLAEAVLSGCAPIALDYAGSGEVMRRLGLEDLLMRPVVHRIQGRRHDGTAAPWSIETVQPDPDQARDVISAAIADPDGTTALLSDAAQRARTELGFEPNLHRLCTGLSRLGIELLPSLRTRNKVLQPR
jgi:glycosyltransferase involved in cell wall biosynthesis